MRPSPVTKAVIAVLYLGVILTFAVSITRAADPPERFAEELAEAQALLDFGKYDDAVVLLERLYAAQPENQRIQELLRRGYQRAGRFEELLALLVSGLPQSPARFADSVGIADCRYRLGEIAGAESTLAALLIPPPVEPDRYRQVANTYRVHGRYLQAEETYLRARRRLLKPTMFSRELADLYESRREYAKAIQEYFVDLEENPQGLARVRQRIAAIARMEEGTAELTGALREIVAENPNSFVAHRLYAELLLESGDAEAAWPEYLAADRLAEDPTDHIVYFIRRCLENGYFAPARRACVTFFARYPGHSATADVQLAHARAFVGLSMPDSAILMLHCVAALFEQPERQAEVFSLIGDVFLDAKNELDSAEVYFRLAVERARRRDDVFPAKVRLGDCRLRRGDLAGADSTYAGCVTLRLTPEQQELIGYKRAELLFFTEQFDSLAGALKSLIAANPRGFFVNDAVMLRLRVTENREPMDWSLKRFAAALLRDRQGGRDSAVAFFAELAADSATGLADDALLELGRLYARIGRPDSAAAAYARLVARYPDRSLAPAALAELGAVYAAQPEKTEAARSAFRRVLTEYADSPYLEEARRRLKDIDRRRPGG